MDYLPLFFNLKGKSCLLVGGGSIALRKARLLTSAGALIRVVAPVIKTELQELVKATGGELIFAPYQAHYLEQAVLVISATDLDELNRQVADDCHQRKLPVNVVDNPRLCSVIMPAIVDRSPLIIGITSGGEAPVLARIVRTKLEAMFPASWGRVGQFASRFRQAVKDRFSDIEERRRFWEASLDGPIFEQALAGNEDAAAQMLQQKLAAADAHEPGGEVYLVGAGPGDPDLLTFKALRLMQKAEVVLYDRLVSQPILDMTRRDAERVYVGKKRADHAVPQTEINQLLLHYAQQGKRVLRLKGGDPFIFGRGGEEIELLAQHNVPFQVVPGITAASGCACYAGIPLTHRDYAQSVRFITGHLKEGGSQLNWSELIAKEQTLVFYMSLVGISEICQQLISHGKDAQTPAALVEKGTTPEQQVHISNLAALPDYVASTEIHAPTLLIIGGVVSLADKLAWFKQAAQSR